MLNLDTIECDPLRRGNEWQLICIAFGIGCILGAVAAVALSFSI